MLDDQLTRDLKSEARRAGFGLVGVCPAVAPTGRRHFRAWLEAGYAGEMHYLAARREAYEHPRHILAGVRSLVMLGMPYRTAEPAACRAGQGRISRYAWGEADYHDVIRQRLRQLARWLAEREPGVSVRGVVDTAPLLEREFGRLAGLGWIGKNTMLINRQAGSWFFLAALLTDLELAYDSPHEHDYCGTCRDCLDACPTQALLQPYVLDATRCLSYLTIELRDSVPAPLRAAAGDWLFGCDICQEVCPWNRRAPVSGESAFAPAAEANPVPLAELFAWTDDAFRARFRRTPLWRAKRRGLLRNAALVAGCQRTGELIDALMRGLQDAEPLVRGACAWALGRYADPRARRSLQDRLAQEDDPQVRDEIAAALSPKTCGA
ncbi:MAG: tRNA epoxyqueuosine(34) reductase QueG [Candidatus Anammoximicrobium sp.]|nr:tRNA epoxyqueuosine(34) reductase QueG [Candidatus Anammoximicrobium sp.]